MELREYFEQTKGYGVLATADNEGKVDAAMYARPHCMDDGTVAFIMAERLTHQNLGSNPHAAYLFIEKGEGYVGKRLYLTRVREETDEALKQEICGKCDYSHYEGHLSRYIVFFRVDKVLPLVGSGE
jgi:hypothetical protein